MKQQQAKVYYQAGNDFLKKRNFMHAISSYKNAIKFYPEYYKAYCNLGVAYKCAGLLEQAEETYEKALKIKPNSGVIFNNLGNVYMQMNRMNDAKALYLKAIKIYPKYKEAYYNLGQAYYFTRENDKALETRIILEKLKRKQYLRF